MRINQDPSGHAESRIKGTVRFFRLSLAVGGVLRNPLIGTTRKLAFASDLWLV